MKKSFYLLCCLSSSLWGKAYAAQFTDASQVHPSIQKGNLSDVNAGGNIAQNFNEHHGGKGGDNHIIIGSP